MVKLRILRVEAAMTILRSYEVPITNLAVECLYSTPHLPVDVFPRDVLLPHELNEPIHVPVSVCDMLRND